MANKPMANKPKNPFEMRNAELAGIVTRIQAILWLEKGACEHCGSCVDIWNPDKQWDTNTLDRIAFVLSEQDLRPGDKVVDKD